MDNLSPIDYKPFHSMAEIAGKTPKIYCRQFVPSLPLQPYIQCFWEMRSEMELQGTIQHRVVPDGCIDIIFDLNSPSYNGAGSVVGTMTKPIFAELERWVNYIAVRFLPGCFLCFFNTPAYHFTDQIVPLESILGKQGCQSIEQLISPASTEDRIKMLEVFLRRSLSENKNRDLIFHNTVYNVLRSKGNIKVSELAKSVNISERQLRRKYNQWIGVSTKTFCRIIRFQSILQSAKSYSENNLFPLALDLGFYDQSHFIHEFSSFYGLTPLEFAKIKKF